ncbi:unnamed protein product [Enterobius vermicularis]|uniref:Uncharacterized protein n=1 Tax=Enterobius vermicularis TaxID=51028 RepID=A0A0N4UY45_ENTVE|nr:unnamed protein product [Enterobius vermicularis]
MRFKVGLESCSEVNEVMKLGATDDYIHEPKKVVRASSSKSKGAENPVSPQDSILLTYFFAFMATVFVTIVLYTSILKGLYVSGYVFWSEDQKKEARRANVKEYIRSRQQLQNMETYLEQQKRYEEHVKKSTEV